MVRESFMGFACRVLAWLFHGGQPNLAKGVKAVQQGAGVKAYITLVKLAFQCTSRSIQPALPACAMPTAPASRCFGRYTVFIHERAKDRERFYAAMRIGGVGLAGYVEPSQQSHSIKRHEICAIMI